jgi:glutathione S-transferase
VKPLLVTSPLDPRSEQLRWTLDLAGVDYDERQHLPAFAEGIAATLGGGWRVPVLVVGGRVLHAPEEVLRWAQRHTVGPAPVSGPPALLDDPVANALAAELSGAFAEATAAFAFGLAARNPEVFAVFAAGRAPLVERWASRWLGAGRRSESGERPLAAARATFDAIAERLRGGPRHLSSDELTFADVTFAALSAPLVLPPHHPVPHPSPRLLRPEDREIVTALRAHPAGAFALRVYAERPLSRGSHARQVFVRTRRFFGQ